MQIQGTTQLQQKLLNGIWQCDTEQDLEDFVDSVDPQHRQQVMLLAECVFLAHIDDSVQSELDTLAARQILDQF